MGEDRVDYWVEGTEGSAYGVHRGGTDGWLGCFCGGGGRGDRQGDQQWAAKGPLRGQRQACYLRGVMTRGWMDG